MSEELIDSTGAPQGNGERPTFLTVLCILTFIGSGLGILGYLLAVIGSSALASIVPVGGGMLIWSIIGLAGAVLCLIGAIQMWGLKKQGFMLYPAGVGIAIVLSLITAFAISGVTVSYGALAFGIAINVGFVAMYNANRPHLIH